MTGLKFAAIMISFLFVAHANAARAAAPGSATAGEHFDRAIFVLFENTNMATALRQPFFGKLATDGAQFSNMLAITHPSQPNYMALASGSTNGVRDDRVIDVDAGNITDLLEAKGLTWKVYAEDYPGGCFTGKTNKNYARKHNPFISFKNIQSNPARCANIVDAQQFDRDIASGTLPNYIFYVPDMRNSGHDTNVAFADQWYKNRFEHLLGDSNFMKRTILISTFDESGPSLQNQIYTSIVGPDVHPGIVSEDLTLYSLLRLVEDNWKLGNLGKQDASAPVVPNIWR